MFFLFVSSVHIARFLPIVLYFVYFVYFIDIHHCAIVTLNKRLLTYLLTYLLNGGPGYNPRKIFGIEDARR